VKNEKKSKDNKKLKWGCALKNQTQKQFLFLFLFITKQNKKKEKMQTKRRIALHVKGLTHS
jgi:hypothetical protein